MSKRMLVIVLCVIALATGALALGAPERLRSNNQPGAGVVEAAGPAALKASAGAVLEKKQAGDEAQGQGADMPEFVVYRQFFRHVAFLKQKAEEREAGGEDASSLRSYYKRQANLDDRLARILDDIAADCNAAVERLDKKAKKITEQFRALNPGGELTGGQLPPAPPAELSSLWEERKEVILQARERLRAAFGEQEFHRLDEQVRRGVVPNIRPVKLNPSNVRMPEQLRKQPSN